MSDKKLRKLSGGLTAHTGPDGFENDAAAASTDIMLWSNLVKVLLDCRDTLTFQADRMNMDGARLELIERAKKSLGPLIAEAMRAKRDAEAQRDEVQRRRIEAAKNPLRDRTHDQAPIFEEAYAGVRAMIEQSKAEKQQ